VIPCPSINTFARKRPQTPIGRANQLGKWEEER
jgi:hypothetical protein